MIGLIAIENLHFFIHLLTNCKNYDKITLLRNNVM